MSRGPHRSALLVAFLLTGACAWRAEPPRSEPVPPAPPPRVLPGPESGAVPEIVRTSASPGLAAADAVWRLGRPLQAQALLEEVRRVAGLSGQAAVEARALLLQAALAWADQDAVDAVELLRSAVSTDPAGASAGAAEMSLDALARLDESERELERVRSRLALAERDQEERAAETQALLEKMTALREQLDALKQVHLETESEKKEEDDPS